MSSQAVPSDIATWTNAMPDYIQAIGERIKTHEPQATSGKAVDLEPLRVYALLKHTISPNPNGVFTLLARGMPLDNMVWWDFVLRHAETYLHVVRTAKLLETHVFGPDPYPGFEPERFLQENLERYARDVDSEIEAFEIHSVYVNHYESYRHCAEWAFAEIQQLRLEPPNEPTTHVMPRSEVKRIMVEAQVFIDESRKFHVLAKSLVLHAAFMVEAFVNNLLRIGAAPPLRLSDVALKICLRTNFRDKLRVLGTFTIVMEHDVDMSNPAVQGVLELMELRNKYVHADESSQHNKLGEVRFDGLFPLAPVSGHSPGVGFTLRTYHHPDRATVERVFAAAKDFVTYVTSLLGSQTKDAVLALMGQTHLGYNESKRVYSTVFNENPFSFYLSAE